MRSSYYYEPKNLPNNQTWFIFHPGVYGSNWLCYGYDKGNCVFLSESKFKFVGKMKLKKAYKNYNIKRTLNWKSFIDYVRYQCKKGLPLEDALKNLGFIRY